MPFSGATIQSVAICMALAKAFLTSKQAIASQLSQVLVDKILELQYQTKKDLKMAKLIAVKQGMSVDTISASVTRQCKTALVTLLSLVKPVLQR